MKIDDVIQRLKDIDLTTYPYQEIKRLLKNHIGEIFVVERYFHEGKQLMRARLNEKYDDRYNKKRDLSYKPKEFNKTYQRASTPYNTMFYACYLSENPSDKEINSMRVPCVMESIYKEFNDKKSSFYKKVTFGRWEVIQDLKLFPLFLSDNFSEKTSYLKEIKDNYDKNLKEIENECIVDKSRKILTYLANEFSKENINGDYDYMISAIFSEIITELGFDGVLYPSVRIKGQSFNIAITPKATEKLKLIAVTESSLYKYKENVQIGNDAFVELLGNEEKFELKQLDENLKIQHCLMDNLGFDSFEDFKNYCDRILK